MRVILLIFFLLPVVAVMGYFYLDVVDEYRKICRGSKRSVRRQYVSEREFKTREFGA